MSTPDLWLTSPDEARAVHDRLVDEIERLMAEMLELNRLQESARLVVAGIERRYPELATEPPAGTSESAPESIAEALLDVFAEDENVWYLTPDLVRALDARGDWLENSRDPEAAVRAALRRLLEREAVRRRKDPKGRGFLYAHPTARTRTTVVRPSTISGKFVSSKPKIVNTKRGGE